MSIISGRDSSGANKTVGTKNDGTYNRLQVDANLEVGDIQIGAVEIKDGDSNTRVDVETVGANNALLVQNALEFQKTKVNNYGTSSIAPSGTVTVATYTVPSGKVFHFTGCIIGGEEYGEFDLEVNGSTVALVRNSGSNRTIPFTFPEPPEASATQIINIKVTNAGNRTKTFEATLSGFIVNA